MGAMMPSIMWSGDGEEWQHYLLLLLKRKYGQNFVEIPDVDMGDYGLEGFSRDGCAYQCYVAENPLNSAALYERQRDKITRDINKFIANSNELVKILGPTKISHWVFVVPHWNTKKLLNHAEKKAQEIRELNLPHVANEFYIDIVDESYFAVEREQLLGVGIMKTKIDPASILESAYSDFLNDHNELIENLERKIESMYPFKSRDDKEKLKMNFITNYITGQNVLYQLNSEYPELYLKALNKKNDREEFLATECMISLCKPAEMLHETVKKYMHELSEELIGLDRSTIERLVYEATSDWLLRCPLEFPDNEAYA